MMSSQGMSDEATPTADGDNRSVPSSTGSLTMKRKSRKSLKSPPKNFFGILYQAMHPDACLRSCHGQAEDDFEEDQLVLDVVLPDILECLDSRDGDVRKEALEDLQRLVDKRRAHNRLVSHVRKRMILMPLRSLKFHLFLSQNSHCLY